MLSTVNLGSGSGYGHLRITSYHKLHLRHADSIQLAVRNQLGIDPTVHVVLIAGNNFVSSVQVRRHYVVPAHLIHVLLTGGRHPQNRRGVGALRAGCRPALLLLLTGGHWFFLVWASTARQMLSVMPRGKPAKT